MMKTKWMKCIKNLSLMMVFFLALPTVQAGIPLWTMVPAAGSNPSQVVPSNAQVTVDYVVHNQSSKPHQLIIKPVSGLKQTSPCNLAPRGQANSSCTLHLRISGAGIPASGIQEGPVLCQTTQDNLPNPNQCYQPASNNTLNISKAGPAKATLTVNGSPLSLLNAGGTGSITVNNQSTTITAHNISATLPADSGISQDASNCQTLPPQGSCTIEFTSSSLKKSVITVPIAGTYTTTAMISINISAPWVTDGQVEALAFDAVNNLIYIGGDFTHVGPRTGSFIEISNLGVVNPNYAEIAGGVYAVAGDGAGGWYIGGDITAVNGVARNRLAHINADGTLDLAWDPGANNFVFALAVDNGTVYVGGFFTSIGGQARNRIAAIDAVSGNATAWNPGANSTVRALVVDNGTVYAGGSFTTIGGQARNRIAAIDAATGNATAWNPGANSTVRALVVDNGTVYAGGQFTAIGGQARNRIAAIDAATGNATAWNPDADSAIYALAMDNGTVYVGGLFSNVGGQARNRIAAIDAATGNATAWNPNADDAVRGLTVDNGIVYAGGDFTTIQNLPIGGFVILNP